MNEPLSFHQPQRNETLEKNISPYWNCFRFFLQPWYWNILEYHPQCPGNVHICPVFFAGRLPKDWQVFEPGWPDIATQFKTASVWCQNTMNHKQIHTMPYNMEKHLTKLIEQHQLPWTTPSTTPSTCPNIPKNHRWKKNTKELVNHGRSAFSTFME